MKPNDVLEHSSRIGLLADSHGNLESILKGVDRLKKARSHKLIHLGDIFDSLHNDNLYEIFEAINLNNFMAVKGNNDFQIETMLNNGHYSDLKLNEKKRIISFLKKLPMLLVNGKICFTHSLPFDSVRSFYEPIDTGSTERAGQLFNETPYQLIFAGHSHSSILFRWRSGMVSREPIEPDEKIIFNPSERYIIIVGSSDNGECGVLDMDQMAYQRINIHL